MAFKSEFMKIFKEGLEPYGFKRMKGTDCFGKLVNEEILLFISFKKYSPPDRGLKAFDVVAGIHTIYSPVPTGFPLQDKGIGIIRSKRQNDTAVNYPYFIYTDDSLSKVLNEALDKTISEIIPAISKVDSLSSCVDYLSKYCLGALASTDKLLGESVLLILSDNHDSFEAVFRQQEELAKRIANEDTSSDYYRYIKKRFFDSIQETIESRDRVWASKELQEAVHKEAARRAEINKAQLRKYGFDI